MTAETRRRARYRRALSPPPNREAAVAQAVDEFVADLQSGVKLEWDDDRREWVWLEAVGDQWAEAARYPTLDAFARAQALDIPKAADTARPTHVSAGTAAAPRQEQRQ